MSEDRDENLQIKLEGVTDEVCLIKEELEKKDSGSFVADYDEKIEMLKNEVKALKILKKQQEKLQKLEQKKKEIIREMELKEGNKRKKHHRHRRKKRD